MASQRYDLGAAFAWLARAMIEAERPVLDDHELQMWDYVVLAALADGPVATQSQLSAVTGRDKTRLIPTLDRLEARGLVQRTPDPADRRNNLVASTPAGAGVLKSCRRAIRALEKDLLADVDDDERRIFVDVLQRLADVARPGDGRP
jgi:DNA-binding MarR family transcriptional regulator